MADFNTNKRIVFTNENQNSQNSIVRNNTIDFARFNINPIILADHDWKALPLGHMTDIQLEQNGNYTGIPVFHKITEESKIYSQLYEGGWLRTASIGGQSVWRKDFGTNQWIKDDKGNKIGELSKEGFLESEYFDLFEISLPTLPANPTAATEESLKEAGVMLSTKIYENEEINNITGQLVTLSSQLKEETMAKEKKEVEAVVEETTLQTEKSKQVTETTVEKDNSNHVILSVKDEVKAGLPGIIKDILSLVKVAFGHPEGEYGDLPIEKEPEKVLIEPAKETGLEAEAKEKQEPESKIKKEAEEKVKACKAKYDEAEGDEQKVSFKKEYQEACKELSVFESDEEAILKTEKKETKMSAIPEMKSANELQDLKLAAAPSHKIQIRDGKTFTQLSTDKGEGAQIMGRIFNGTHEGKSINDYQVVLNSIMADPKYKTIADKARFHVSANNEEMTGIRQGLNNVNRTNSNVGLSFREVAGRLNAGFVNGHDYKLGADVQRTTLSTDGVFSSLDTVAVEWLNLVIFKLFPSESWKNEIPLFSAQESGRNLGIIWTNIAADQAIYRGTVGTPSAYTYSDTAVGVKLVSYWIQPITWNPLYMHQLRYDQQATGWAQALRKLEAQVGDDLLYTFGAGALANNKILYTGGPVDQTQGQNFTVGTGSNGVDKFYFNSAYNGTLLKPGFNDIMKIEQFFAYDNFDLASEKVVLVGDTIANSYIKQDKATQSLLTRWINENGADIQKISHTQFHERSRVLAYDPNGGTVIDTHASGAVIPTTTQSANMAFVASQMGIALGLIDVFFVQNPLTYGYTMSMDMRIGGRALRSDYTGATIYAYNSGAQVGS